MAATNPTVYVKLLISNGIAGSIIGKVGMATQKLGFFDGGHSPSHNTTRLSVQLQFPGPPAGQGRKMVPPHPTCLLPLQGGTNINDFQAKTFARIQLSKSQEYYPGTQDRTLLISGRLKQVVAALALILDKLVGEGAAPFSPRSRLHQEPDRAPRLLLKMLVPQPLCGIIIGKAGATIRSFSNDTQTTIR